MRQKFKREFDAAGQIEGATELLIDGLTYNYDNNWGNVQDFFNPARKIIERIFDKLKDAKILPPISALNAIKRLLEKTKIDEDNYSYELKEEIMPAPLVHSLKYFLDITQDGSHDNNDLELGVDSYIRNSRNTNLYQSVLFIAMDLLLWYSEVSKKYSSSAPMWSGGYKYEYIGKLCISPDGRYWYTGEYELMSDSKFVDGAKIGIKKSIINKKARLGIKRFVPKGCYTLLPDNIIDQ